MTIDVDDVGSVTKVTVNRPGIGFKNIPTIFIESDTGYNAKLIPVFNVKRIGSPTQEEIDKSLSADYITVVDCVGKFNV